MYIDDCVRGIQDIMHLSDSEYPGPLNLGSSRSISINGLVDIIENIAGINCEREYDLTGPVGVGGRNSDNTLFKSIFGWEPDVPLETGLEETYRWVYDQVSV